MAITGFFAAALTLASSIAQASLINNGGFELVTSSAPGSFVTVLPTSWKCAGAYCSPAAAVFAPGTADVISAAPFRVYTGFPFQSPGGGNFYGADACYSTPSNCPLQNTTPVIYQEVNTTGGQLTPGTYTVSFLQAGGQWAGYTGATTTQWEVGLGSTCLLSCSDSASFVGDIKFSTLMVNSPGGNGSTGTFVPWQLQTLTFTVTSGTTPQYLSFVPLGNVAIPPTVFLDAVALQAPTPEASTVSMLGLGLLGLTVVGLRRRAKRDPSIVESDTDPAG